VDTIEVLKSDLESATRKWLLRKTQWRLFLAEYVAKTGLE
jgi:hypothetical protein